jgi:hypothetical protein
MQTRCVHFRSSVLGIRPSALIRYRVSGTRCQVAGAWYLAPDTWMKGQDPTGFPVYVPKNAHTGKFAFCILHPHLHLASCILHLASHTLHPFLPVVLPPDALPQEFGDRVHGDRESKQEQGRQE